MNKRYLTGNLGKLEITAEKSAAGGFVLVWAAHTLMGMKLFRLRRGTALIGGLLGAVLHFASELWHQMGHARAAEHTGHPMQGIHVWGALATSIYPEDEPPLPDEVHVARAMGGPRASAALAVIGGLLTLAARPSGGIVYMLTALLGMENLLVFTLGALLPLPFIETDGDTLRRYRGGHRRRMITIQE